MQRENNVTDYISLEDKLKYFNKILKKIHSNKDELDKNDLYELVYLSGDVESILAFEELVPSLRKRYEILLSNIKLILMSVNEDRYVEIINREVSSAKRLDKERYNKEIQEEISKLKDKSKTRLENPMQRYLAKIACSALITFVLGLFVMSGGAFEVTNKVVDIVSGVTVEENTATNNIEENTATINIDEVKATDNTDELKVIGNMIKVIINAITLVVIMTKLITISLDLMYLAFPVFRYTMGERKLISNDAREVAESGELIYGSLDVGDRYNLAEQLINNLNSSEVKVDDKYKKEVAELSKYVRNKKNNTSIEYTKKLVECERLYREILGNNKLEELIKKEGA